MNEMKTQAFYQAPPLWLAQKRLGRMGARHTCPRRHSNAARQIQRRPPLISQPTAQQCGHPRQLPRLPPRWINRYLHAQMVEEMVALHRAGQTVAQIATRFGFHRTTVARHLKQAGETLPTNLAGPAFQEQVRQAYAELGTVKHTAQRLGVGKDTVRKMVRGGTLATGATNH